MKQIDAPGKLFQLRLNGNFERYDGKTVEFLFDLDQKLLVLAGQFVVHATPESECVDIHYAGRLDPHDPPYTSYTFHLSQAHVSSTVRANKPGSKVDFLIERPLWSRECERNAFEDRVSA